MKKIIIFGNSGSGKTTLAAKLCCAHGLVHLDLDTLAWAPTTPPQRSPHGEAASKIALFMEAHNGWVIEGCYTDLLEIAAPGSTEAIYLNIPAKACIANARARPWEPHKYASREAQNANLEMLIQWILEYDSRTDTCSALAHRQFYARYQLPKTMLMAHESQG